MLFVIEVTGLLLSSVVAAFTAVALLLGAVFALISFAAARPVGIRRLNKDSVYILCGLGLILLFLILQIVSILAFKTLAFAVDSTPAEYLLAGKALLISAGIQALLLVLCSGRFVPFFLDAGNFSNSGIRFNKTQLWVLLAGIVCMLISGVMVIF